LAKQQPPSTPEEPYTPELAQRLIRAAIRTGIVTLTSHARDEMKADHLDMADVLNVLRGGWVEEPEYENRAWRYRVRTNRLCVVVEFRSETEIVVVTAWRF
jgi:Domain of unknown function (DUF4258)